MKIRIAVHLQKAERQSLELVEEGRYGCDVFTVRDHLAFKLDARLGTQLPFEVGPEHFLALGAVSDADSNGEGRGLGWEDGRSQEHDRHRHRGASAHVCKQEHRSCITEHGCTCITALRLT